MVSDPVSPSIVDLISEAEQVSIDAGDVTLTCLVWPGDDDVIVFAHATGFHKEIWAPTVRSLRGRDVTATVVSVDQRGHGDSTVPDHLPSIWEYAEDLHTVVADLRKAGSAVGVGHSMGGAATAGCEARHPGTFDGIVLIDPALMSRERLAEMHRTVGNPWSDAALRRRRAFRDRDAAFRAYDAKHVFAAWPAEVLQVYVDHGFRVSQEGWELKCGPEWEAATFSQPDFPEAWEAAASVAAPLTLITAEHSVTHPAHHARETAQHLRARHVRLPGVSHFIPMEAPDEVAAEVARMLADLRADGDRHNEVLA